MKKTKVAKESDLVIFDLRGRHLKNYVIPSGAMALTFLLTKSCRLDLETYALQLLANILHKFV